MDNILTVSELIINECDELYFKLCDKIVETILFEFIWIFHKINLSFDYINA